MSTRAAHCLGPVAAIPLGEGRVFRVADKDIAIFRLRSGGVFASDAECPHRGGPLADGLVGDHCVVCPLHGFTFDLRTGYAPGPDCPPLVIYPVHLDARGNLTLEIS